MKQTLHNFIFVVAMLVASATFAYPAHAGRYEFAQENLAEGLSGAVTDRDACTAFLKNLKKFENLPYGMACRRELDPTLGFARPTWEKLDILTHVPLAIAIIHSEPLMVESWLPKDPKQWDARIKEMAEKENLTMDLTRIDLLGDGKLKNLVRFGFGGSCDPKLEIDMSLEVVKVRNKHRHLFVLDETLTKVDPYPGISLAIDDVFTYKGKTFTDRFWPEPLNLRKRRKRIGSLDLMHFSEYGLAAHVCTFVYTDTPNQNGGDTP